MKENQKFFHILDVITDGILLVSAVVLAYFVRFYILSGSEKRLPLEIYLIGCIIVIPVMLIIYSIYGLYNSYSTRRFEKECFTIFLCNSAGAVGVIGVLYTIKLMDISRFTVALWLVFSTAFMIIKRVGVRAARRNMRKKGLNRRAVLIVGGGELAQQYLTAITEDDNLGLVPMGYVAPSENLDAVYLGDFSVLEDILQNCQPDQVVIALEAPDIANMDSLIGLCEKNGIKTSIIPFYSRYLSEHPTVDVIGGVSLLNIRKVLLADSLLAAFCKRSMDVLGSLLLIVLTSPFMLVAAIGTKLSSPGPVIFKQQRVGRNNKVFTMYKFRSMRINAQSTTAWSTNADPRKTKFGSFIRKCSMDELPQFFNVLKGDMSLVGPRPEIPHFVEEFKEKIPLYMVKHQVRPGITGWAQVNGLRGDTSIEERIRHDIYYIENWSLWLDIKILFMTVFKGMVNKEKVLK